MRCSLSLLTPAAVLAAWVAALAQTPAYNLGRTPGEEEIRAWDISVGPAGKELPPGSGTAKEGATIYAQRCARCHGPTGADGMVYFDPNERPGPPLVGGQGTLTSLQPVKTVGSYWPFATTLWDYINRAMPRYEPGSLTANEVYAVTALLLHRNGIIQESDVLDAKTLPKIQMPNRNGFLPAPWPQPDLKLYRERCRLGTCP